MQTTGSIVTQNGAAIVLYVMMGVAAYFLRQFATGVDQLRKDLQLTREWVIRIATRVGVEERKP